MFRCVLHNNWLHNSIHRISLAVQERTYVVHQGHTTNSQQQMQVLFGSLAGFQLAFFKADSLLTGDKDNLRNGDSLPHCR